VNEEPSAALVPRGTNNGGGADLTPFDRPAGSDQGLAPRGWWDDVVTRVRATPDVLTEAVDRLLDLTVASAAEHPIDVHTPDEAAQRVAESWSAGRANPAGLVAGWLASRWATRTLRIGKRFSLPVSAVLTAVPPLALSWKRGTLELRVLASYVVNRLRAEGVEVDERFVQRITVNTYCWPETRSDDVVGERPAALVRLATLWATRAVVPDEPGVRVRDAARAVAELDLRALTRRFER
jgi:hypothetical protein